MCARYYYYEKPDAGDVFGSIMATLVIVGILLYLAICISFYILMVFCGIGVLIGTVYALVVYLKSFVFVCRRVWYSSAGGNRLLGILTKWLVIIKDTSISAFCENFRTAGKAFSNAGMYRFLSFRKWNDRGNCNSDGGDDLTLFALRLYLSVFKRIESARKLEVRNVTRYEGKIRSACAEHRNIGDNLNKTDRPIHRNGGDKSLAERAPVRNGTKDNAKEQWE